MLVRILWYLDPTKKTKQKKNSSKLDPSGSAHEKIAFFFRRRNEVHVGTVRLR